ncbi:hypothetical protein [Hydrogenophaga sp.]|uniref:hypothetical protein n=1 Tax=Hydrogenophaga sp. TaxID=1904254 RepID=UPI00271EC087|nr:hypothetical protein [Hydrogenophaga sp.]MDO9434707.1 hypothetical protein [Hydrogenophaga sp.]
MTHFTLEAAALDGQAEHDMASFLRAHPTFDAEATAAFQVHPVCRLRQLTFIGVSLPPLYLSAYCEMLRGNTTLEEFNVWGCYMNVGTALHAPDILKNNQTLRTARFPAALNNYFLRSKDGGIHGISKHGQLIVDVLYRANSEAMNPAWDAFDAVREHLFAAPTAAQAALDRRTMEEANHELRWYVGRFMSVATSPGGTHTFDDPAGLVMQHLGDARSLRDVVHLSELGKTVDRHRFREGQPTPASVKTLVTGANAEAVSQNLSTAPLKVNTVSGYGANRDLRTAVRENDPVKVRDRKEEGAINFQGLVDRDVRSQAVLGALRAPVTTTTEAIITKGTSTATTTTTVTTSTTLTTTDATDATDATIAVTPEGTEAPKEA